MSTSLPARLRTHNRARTTSAPSAVTVVLARPLGDDASRTILRDTFDSVLPRAIRFARSMLTGAAARYGLPLEVQVFDADGAMLFAETAGGAS